MAIGRRIARGVRLHIAMLALVAIPTIATAPGSAQTIPRTDTNILLPIPEIEARLRAPLIVVGLDMARPIEADRSRRVTLADPNDGTLMEAHWKPVAPPGQGFNNEPRYALAAYRLQRMFLDEPDYVVPPTVLRAMSAEEYRRYRTGAYPTIRNTRSVLFLLSYWVHNLAVDTVDPFDQPTFDLDDTYARHFANANILTHLIDHRDGNRGNVLVSLDGVNRRVFAVDNDVAFRSQTSDLGDRWRRLTVARLPAGTIDRLRQITREGLEAELGVVAEFAIVDGLLEPVPLGPNLGPRRGVRVTRDRVQFGLTQAEIGDLERRIARLLQDVDRGRFETF